MISRLSRYSSMVYAAGTRFNLTGFKTLEDITANLVISSLEPVLHLDVPRGTRIIDLGSGSGVPGIPMSIFHGSGDFLLVESNEKKSAFIADAIEELSLKNATSLNARAEEIGHNPEYRESFDFVFTRAFSSTYITLELALPLLLQGGSLYIYAHESFRQSSPSGSLLSHVELLGAFACDEELQLQMKLPMTGYLFRKISPTPERYPRRYAIIKRDSSRFSS